MAEAALSFLGFGLPPDIPSWGGMLSREVRQYTEIAPHLALWPGVCLTVVVYSLNMFGDAVRDLLDPRLRGRLGRYGAGREERVNAISDSVDLNMTRACFEASAGAVTARAGSRPRHPCQAQLCGKCAPLRARPL